MTTASTSGVIVIEPPLPQRVRRPADLLRLVVALVALAAIVAAADLAVGTARGLEQDLIGASDGLPRLLLELAAIVAGVGVLVVPLAVGADLLVRRRPWQLLDALAAAGVGGAVALGFGLWVTKVQPDRLLPALTKTLPGGGHSQPVEGLLVTIVAFLTVAELSGRRPLRPGAIVFVLSVATTQFLSGRVTAVALAVSLVLGWAVGLAVRFGLGAGSTRPAGTQVADALVDCGVPVTELLLREAPRADPRLYLATLADGSAAEVRVLDRDTYGFGVAGRVFRRLRLRGPATRRSFLTVRSALDHEALMALAVGRAGVLTPQPLAVCEAGPYAALIAYRSVAGQTFADLDVDTVSDEALTAAFTAQATLARAKVGHRSLSVDHLVLVPDGQVALLDVAAGEVAAAELTLRLDSASLLTALAALAGPARAVDAATKALGEDAVVAVLPLLQRIALPRSTRQQLREQRSLLRDLRGEILARIPPGEAPADVELRRVRPRTVFLVAGLTFAGYLLLTQLGSVDYAQLFAQAQWQWAAVLVVLSGLTYVGASLTITGAVQARLRFVRTYLAQLAVSFTGLVAPTAVGNIAINTRYLERNGVDPAVAAASVGLAQVGQFTSYACLLILFGVLAGTGPAASFLPSQYAVVVVLAVVGAALVFVSLPWGRRLVTQRVRPVISRVVPQIVAILQRPAKLATLLGGALLLDLSYVLALDAATRAFGGHLALPAVALVYFTAAVVGSAVPTPGGLGGVEAALATGLAAAGLHGLAVPTMLLYRLATYWLPIPFGWLSLQRLQKVGQL